MRKTGTDRQTNQPVQKRLLRDPIAIGYTEVLNLMIVIGGLKKNFSNVLTREQKQMKKSTDVHAEVLLFTALFSRSPFIAVGRFFQFADFYFLRFKVQPNLIANMRKHPVYCFILFPSHLSYLYINLSHKQWQGVMLFSTYPDSR